MISFEGFRTYLKDIDLDQTNGYLYFAATSTSYRLSIGYIGVIDPSSLKSKTLITSLYQVYGLAIYPSKG